MENKFTIKQCKIIAAILLVIAIILSIVSIKNELFPTNKEKIKETKQKIKRIEAKLESNDSLAKSISNHGKKAAKNASIKAEQVIKESNIFVPTKNEYEGAVYLVNYGKTHTN